MVVEVLGARILNPFFGVGLFAWAALLTVTLASLMVGYFLGGEIARRGSDVRRLYTLVVLAGLLVAVIPLLRRPVLALFDPLGVKAGTLLSALVLFGPSLFVLGTVSPMAVHFSARDHDSAGSAAGWVYGISTAGGVAATLLTGFVLVPHLSLSTTLVGTAALLLAVGAVGLLPRVGAALLLPLAGLPWLASGTDEPVPGVRVLERSESLYGQLAVLEDHTHGQPLRVLRSDHSLIGGLWVEAQEPAFAFVHLLEAIRFAHPAGRDLLLIGLGIGSLSTAMARSGVRCDVVEIDPGVVDLAKRHFGFEPQGEVFVEDARTFIRRTSARYDFIVHDTFTGGTTPAHLLSREVLEQIRAILEDEGVLALNYVGAVDGPLVEPTRAVYATLRAVFPYVRAFRDKPLSNDPDGVGNVVFFASRRSIAFSLPERMAFESPARKRVQTSFLDWEVTFADSDSAPVVTDAHNPLAWLAIPVSEAVRGSMSDIYPREVWLD